MTLKEVEEELKRRGVKSVHVSWAPHADKVSINRRTRDLTKFLEEYLKGNFKRVNLKGL